MADTFQTRIPTLTDDELRAYLDGHLKYKPEAVEAAAAELRRRGLDVPEASLARIRAELKARDAAKRAPARPGFLRDAKGPRLERIRLITAAIVATGLIAALAVHRAALRATPAPFDLEPSDSKAYLRQVEMMGGKANLLASQIRLWFTGLWEGTTLAHTLFWITVITAALFYLAATRRGAAR